MTFISIHAPARGATGHKCPAKEIKMNFNPRTREGCDPPSSQTPRTPSYFNPRTREGCDLNGLQLAR